jgi:hypothetical protein
MSENRKDPGPYRFQDIISSTYSIGESTGYSMQPVVKPSGLVLNPTVRERITHMVEEFICFGDIQNPLNRFGMRALIVGAEDNGKTTLAAAIAAELGFKLHIVCLDMVMSTDPFVTHANLVNRFVGKKGEVLLFDDTDSYADHPAFVGLRNGIVSIARNLASGGFLIVTTRRWRTWRSLAHLFDYKFTCNNPMADVRSQFFEKHGFPPDGDHVELTDSWSFGRLARLCRDARRRQYIEERQASTDVSRAPTSLSDHLLKLIRGPR